MKLPLVPVTTLTLAFACSWPLSAQTTAPVVPPGPSVSEHSTRTQVVLLGTGTPKVLTQVDPFPILTVLARRPLSLLTTTLTL
jgi:hypothetical protein